MEVTRRSALASATTFAVAVVTLTGGVERRLRD